MRVALNKKEKTVKDIENKIFISFSYFLLSNMKWIIILANYKIKLDDDYLVHN
jgi:hypothetical protein